MQHKIIVGSTNACSNQGSRFVQLPVVIAVIVRSGDECKLLKVPFRSVRGKRECRSHKNEAAAANDCIRALTWRGAYDAHAERRMDQVHRIVKEQWHIRVVPGDDAEDALREHGLLVTRAIEAVSGVVVKPEVSRRCQMPSDHARLSALGGIGFRVNVGDIATPRAACSGE